MPLGAIGKYERLDVLGHGASGIVYLARDTLLRRQVAIKEVSVHGEERDRLLEEARVLDRLRHPNIVDVHGVESIDGKLVIDMEFVDGPNLAEILRRADGALPYEQARQIALQVCEGLAYAQARRVVHRDIKPANVLVARDGTVKLVDFGLAQVLGTNSVVAGAGTYAYMAPEDFAETDGSDSRSDIWAVGVILYEMLTGRRPFAVGRPKDPFAWKRAVETEPVAPPSALRPEVPEPISAACMRALERDRTRRFQTAAEMAQALRAASAEAAPTPLLLGASSLDGFLAAVPERWEEARALLVDGRLTAWLELTGHASEAQAAHDASQQARGERADYDAILKEFLERAGVNTAARAAAAADRAAVGDKQGRHDDAARLLMQSIRLDPSKPSYFAQLHRALLAAHDPAAAAAALARGLEHHPRDKNLRREQSNFGRGAAPVVSASIVDFGTLRHGERAKARVTVKGAAGGTGMLQGRVASLPGWVDVTPMSFIVRRRQVLSLVANTADLWEREQEYEGRVELDTNSGPLDIGLRVCVRPPLRSFQEVFGWYMPLLALCMAPVLAGEAAALRHPRYGEYLPYFAPGMVASGLLFAALWQVTAGADAGPKERFFAGLGALMTLAGAWLAFVYRDPALAGAYFLCAVPTGMLLVLQGFALLRSQGRWGSWRLWGWLIAAVGCIVTVLFWRQTEGLVLR